MMKLCICFLVVASSAVSRVENATNDSSHEVDQLKTEAPQTMLSSPAFQNNISENTTDLETAGSQQAGNEDYRYLNETKANSSTVAPVTTSVSKRGNTTVKLDNVEVTTSSREMGTTSKPVLIQNSASSSWGYVILVLIILVIIILCIILYFLRRVSRTYSFDLQRPSPVSRLNEPIGTFEPVYLDDLDQPAPKDQVTTDDLSSPPVANGTSLPSEEKASSGESAPQEHPDANGLETSPVSNTSPSSGDESSDKASSPSTSTNFLFDGTGEEQKNENNNNPFVCSGDPFVEINLDEPALCDQLLTSPQATSSVLPFSFSLTSSSS